MKALQALLKSGDKEKIIYFASKIMNSKDRRVRAEAARYICYGCQFLAIAKLERRQLDYEGNYYILHQGLRFLLY